MTQEAIEEIPFNVWSRKRIAEGRKFCTSRKKMYDKDPRVERILDKVPWGFIKKYFYGKGLEGADSPEELQRVINQIFRRKVEDNEEFYLHFGNFREKGEKK